MASPLTGLIVETTGACHLVDIDEEHPIRSIRHLIGDEIMQEPISVNVPGLSHITAWSNSAAFLDEQPINHISTLVAVAADATATETSPPRPPFLGDVVFTALDDTLRPAALPRVLLNSLDGLIDELRGADKLPA